MFTVYRPWSALEIILALLLVFECDCYEKTLRKIVRDQSKMVQRPFSDSDGMLKWKNSSQALAQTFMHPGFAQVKSVIHKIQRPKISTILSSVETNKGKSAYSRIKIDRNDHLHPYEIRLSRDAFSNMSDTLQNRKDIIFPEFKLQDQNHKSNTDSFAIETYYQIPQTNYFPTLDESQQVKEQASKKESSVLLPEYPTNREDIKMLVKEIVNNVKNKMDTSEIKEKTQTIDHKLFDSDMDNTDFLIEEVPTKPNPPPSYNYNHSTISFTCTKIHEAKADIDLQETFSELNIEPPWTAKRRYWNSIYESRYASLMKNPKWPPLKVILIPRSHVDTIWKKPFEDNHNSTVRKILSNVIKKLQFYSNLTFTWNEVSHLSQWWKTASQKSRAAVRRLVKEGRFEITTGGWVETDEATSNLFGLLHQLIEGHQWLQQNLNYIPDVAWLTNSVTHSPTLPYLLSMCDISKLVITNVHFALEQYLAEYQHADFVWIQSWDKDIGSNTELNEVLNKMGNERYAKHSVLTHYLQFNSAGFMACGPDRNVCLKDFNFAKSNENVDVSSYNIKSKSEKLLEQYSKTGTLTPHNVIMAPIGGPYRYETQNEFDYQFNNYKRIADFVNVNQDIYKASIEFGTPKDYFKQILQNHKTFPTVKGDFLNFADISTGVPAYWSGFFTSRPHLKILLRRLQSALRTTEILFSFALSFNAFHSHKNISELFERLINAREVVARLQDRNVVSGTLTARALKYAHSQISNTAKDCWEIQEVAISLLTSKPEVNTIYVKKYVYSNGEFVSAFKSVAPGDQIYIFNSLTQERVEIVELISRYPNLRIIDHNKKDVTIQINPIWQYTAENIITISRQFYKIVFTVILPPMGLGLYNIKDTYDGTHSASTVYCLACLVEDIGSNIIFPFNIQPVETGDIQVENYKHRLIFDEYTGFLKTVVQKATSRERMVVIDYGAFRSSNVNSGMFLFNTNISRPLQDILLPYRTGAKSKIVLIISGQVMTEVITIYGKLLQHTVKLFNILYKPLDNLICVESRIDYEVSPKNRDLEIFLSFQTDVANNNPPSLFIDNNGFQYTSRSINISRRVESNVYPMTSMAFIQDKNSRFTVLTDHAQGVTALQEGQLVIMLDRRVLFNDNRGTGEGLADNSATSHTHYVLLEDFATVESEFDNAGSASNMKLPSLSALYLATSLNYNLDIYFIEKNMTNLSYYAFLPLIKTSFPCDVFVISYRVILNSASTEKNSPSSALLILHRQSFSCQFKYDNNLSCSGDSSFNINKIFRNIRQAYQTNLVGTNKGVLAQKLTLSNFPSMELITFQVYF